MLIAGPGITAVPSVTGQLSQPVLGIWPIIVNDTSLTPPQSVTVDVNVTDSPALGAFDIRIVYDQDVLSFVDAFMGPGTLFDPGGVIDRTDVIPPTVRIIGLISLPVPGGSGVLVHVVFSVVKIGVSPLGLYETILAGPAGEIQHTTRDAYFTNTAKRGPVVDFTADPPEAVKGQQVTLDASNSFDPDNSTLGRDRGIKSFKWFYGSNDGTSTVTKNPVILHVMGGELAPRVGTFWVRLIAEDYEGNEGLKTVKVTVSPAASHNVRIFRLIVDPLFVSPGQDVSVTIVVDNIGTFSETFNLTLELRQNLLQSWEGGALDPRGSKSFTFPIKTGGLASGVYAVTATARITQDDSLDDNTRTEFLQIGSLQASILPFLLGGSAAVIAATGGFFVARRLRSRSAARASEHSDLNA